MCNKKVLISDANLTIALNLKNSYKQKKSFIFYKISQVANIKIEAP